MIGMTPYRPMVEDVKPPWKLNANRSSVVTVAGVTDWPGPTLRGPMVIRSAPPHHLLATPVVHEIRSTYASTQAVPVLQKLAAHENGQMAGVDQPPAVVYVVVTLG